MLKIDPTDDAHGESLSEPTAPVRPVQQVTQLTKIDRIDDRGNIREHLTRDGRRTICGVEIGQRQAPCGNSTCRRCEKIAACCQNAAPTASEEQTR